MSDGFVSFDNARERVVAALRGAEIPVERLYLVRNMFGKVRISVSERHEEDEARGKALQALALRVGEAAGPHGHPPDLTGVLFVPDELLNALRDRIEPVTGVDGAYWAERLVSGRGWWTAIERRAARRARRWTLFSVKGGVGRSATAAALARHLARGGERVLVVDLDLESPCLSSAMLAPGARPEFGVVDWFVEDLVGQGDHAIENMTAAPAWADGVESVAAVAPAHGRDPGQYLAKLGRVHMETAKKPWAARLERLLAGLEARLEPTIVLIDSRCGLHDVAAATVMDIDAHVLLFAADSESNWVDYGILFRHWRERGLATAIRHRLSMVSALTPPDDEFAYLSRFRERSWRLFRDHLYDTDSADRDSNRGFSFDLQDGDAPHNPLPIFRNDGLAAGTPSREPEEAAVGMAYREFFDRFAALTGPREETPARLPTPAASEERRTGAKPGTSL